MCDFAYPDGVACGFPQEGLHAYHFRPDGSDLIANASCPPAPVRPAGGRETKAEGARRRREAEQALREKARAVKPEVELRPVVRNDDPWTSHVAAERIEPKRGTRKHLALQYLLSADGRWVDGTEIATPDVGGSEGLRRVRELADDGWPIERRPHPASATSWQYRLVADLPVTTPPLRNFD